MRTLAMVLGFAALAASAACGHHERRPVGPPPPPTPWPRTLAILPLANTTVSVDGPEVLRRALAAYATNRGYVVQPLGETDEKLRGIGITLGGQIAGVKLAELKTALGTDGVLGGTLTEHKNIALVVENKQILAAEIHLDDLIDERTVWSAHDRREEAQSYNVSHGNGLSNAITGAVSVGSAVAKNNLQGISDHLAAQLCGRMPHGGRGHEGFAPPPPPPGAAPSSTPPPR